MRLDTEQCAEISAYIATLFGSPAGLEDKLLYSFYRIQQGLADLKAFFDRLNSMGNMTEDSLMSSVPYSTSCSSGFQAKWNTSGSVAGLLTGSAMKANGSVHYSLASANAVYDSRYLSAQAGVNALEASAGGMASIRLKQKGAFKPEMKLEGHIQGSVLNGHASADLSNSFTSASIEAVGEVGTVYATAQAVVKPDEVTVEAGVGAAAVRGECSLAFSLLGAAITLTAEGSACSAEASMSFSHKNREWEIGSKLGFIAGIGFKLKVEY